MIINPALMGESPHYPLISLPEGIIITSAKEDIKGMLAVDMAMIHNVFIRGVNSVFNNAPKIAPQDVAAFVGYCLVVIDSIHDHHEYEEMFIFPVLEKRIPEIARNVEQHKMFHEGMDAFKQYMIAVKDGNEEYDGEKTRRLCKGFADSMVRHLHDEILTLSPDKISAFDDEPQLLQDMMKSINEHVKNKPGKLTALPFVTTHHDFSKAPNWPPIPGAIKWFARHIAPYFNSSYWRFSPFKRDGSPQTYTPSGG